MKVIDFKLINDFAATLISSAFLRDFRDVARFITEKAAQISGADRISLILYNNGEFVIEGGFPSNGHGIGESLKWENGTNFLQQVMENQNRVLVLRPERDARTAYLKDIVRTYNISSILFVPLYIEEKDLGLLVLDYCKGNEILSRLKKDKDKDFSKEYYILIRYVANHIVQAVMANSSYAKRKEEIRRIERLATLGLNAASFAHTLRNDLTPAGGFAKRILKYTSVNCPDCVIVEYARIICSSVAHSEKKIEDVLSFARPITLQCEKCNINELVWHGVHEFSGSDLFAAINIETDFDKRLERIKLLIDKQRVKDCLWDLLRNAVEANAVNILVKNKLSSKNAGVTLFVLNDGERLAPNPVVRDTLFVPFMTTKRNGTGLGLANVKRTVEAHSGVVEISSKDVGRYNTEVKIWLPIPIGKSPH